jgi:hypothetical protein
MESSSTNPLAKHFRQPKIYIKLPSEGRWYPKDSLEMTKNGELPVYAMTAKDELTLKTPDALLNGQSTVDVIESCVPSIKDGWAVPAVDLDYLLISIRQATYGNGMDFFSMCPHCNTKNENTIDLSAIKESIPCPDYKSTLTVDDLTFYFRPQNYKQFNQSSLENFEQQRLLSIVADTELDNDVKLAKFHQMFNKLLKITVESISNAVATIKINDGTIVDDSDQIAEFFDNCNREVFDAVKSHIEKIGDANPLKRIPIVCDNEDCGKNYNTPLVFEQASFFG